MRARVALALTLPMLLAACGGGTDAPAQSSTEVSQSATPNAATPAPAPAGTPAASPSTSPTSAAVPTGSLLTWRPFSADSPWNTPIPADAQLESNSAQLVSAFIKSTPWGEHLDINIAKWSVPMYWAKASTPLKPMRADTGGLGWMGSPSTLNMPIPDGARPDPESDAHMVVISEDRSTEWGCYAARYNAAASPAWQAALCATSDLTGTGVRTPEPQAFPWYVAHGPRACGFPLSAGLIRVEEIKAGRIDHALALAYPGLLPKKFMSPASTSSAIGDAINGVGVPCGGRFQLDPSIDVTKLGLSRAGEIVARALQQYGAYVGDYSGALSLYAENSPEAQTYWSGVMGTYDLLDKVDLNKLRVIKYATVY